MNDNIEPVLKDGKCLCPHCGHEVKRSIEVILTATPFYTYYCTNCKYSIEIQQKKPYKEAKVYYPQLSDDYKQIIIKSLVAGELDLVVDSDTGKIEVCGK